MLSPIRFFILAIICAYSSAQRLTADAKCRDEYVWMYTSLRQSPCDVAYELASVCVTGGRSNPDPLDPGYVYIGPTPTYSNRCYCSSVYYSLLSACGYCQGRDYISWGDFTGNCTNRYHQVFPEPLPVGLRVQPWAYEDVENSDSGKFNVTLAQSLRGGEESTRPTHTAVPSNVPVIVGVVVGVVVLALIGGLCAFFLIRRRKKRRSRGSSAFKPGLLKSPNSLDNAQGARYSPAPTTLPSPQSPTAKLYNPNDPSTYPTMTSIPSSCPESLSYRQAFPLVHQSCTPSEQNPSPVMSGRSKAAPSNSYFAATPEL